MYIVTRSSLIIILTSITSLFPIDAFPERLFSLFFLVETSVKKKYEPNSTWGHLLNTPGCPKPNVLMGVLITKTFLWPPGSQRLLHVCLTVGNSDIKQLRLSAICPDEKGIPFFFFLGFKQEVLTLKSCLKWILVEKAFSSCFCKRWPFFFNAEWSSWLTSVWLPEYSCAFFPPWISRKSNLHCTCAGSWVTIAHKA